MSGTTQFSDADPYVQECIATVNSLLDGISSASRKDENTLMVLQQYDIMFGSPEVSQLADLAASLRDEVDQLQAEEWALDVRSPAFIIERLRVRRGSGPATGDSGAVNYQQHQQHQPNAMTDRERANANTSAPAANTTFAASNHMNYVATAEDSGPQSSMVPAAANARAALWARQALEQAWGTCLQAAMQQMPDEDEHHHEMMGEFERLFQRASDYLRALHRFSSGIIDVLRLMKLNEGYITPDTVLAAMTKHTPSSTDELAEVLAALDEGGVHVTLPVAEALERAYVRCMKAEGAEEVFARMTASGLVPLSTRPFAMLFNVKPPLKKVKSVLDYYELMLDYGIAPETSTLRILTKQCSGMEYATLHFTLRQKNQAATEEPPATRMPAASAPTAAAGATVAAPDSRRKNERAYFETRLEEMAEADPTTPLLEAMKVIHRAEVEGTSLEGDTLILSALLRLFCNGTTPLKELVHPFTHSLAYQPKKVVYADTPVAASVEEDAGAAATASGARAIAGMPVERFSKETNAFDFGLENATDELLEDDEPPSQTSTGGARKGGGAAANGLRDQHTPGKHGGGANQPRTNAFQNEEAAYVLAVLASYGSVPDNKLLRVVSTYCESKVNGLAVVEQVVRAMFAAGRDARGAMEAVRCSYCHALVHHFVRRHQRNRLLQLVRSFVLQYYEYTELFQADWAGENFDDNGKGFIAFAAAAMKPGPIDWALGLFVLVLMVSDCAVTDNIKARLLQFRDSDYYRTPHHDVLNELENCGWNKSAILTCDALMVESFDSPHPTDASTSAGNGNCGKISSPIHQLQQQLETVGSSNSNHQSNGAISGGNPSIYTAGSPESGAHGKHRGADARPTLFSYMHIALREMNIEKEVMDWFRGRLKAERRSALHDQV